MNRLPVLTRVSGGVWAADASAGVDVPLSASMALDLARRDVEAFLVLSAPGRDRVLRPRIRFEFGRRGGGVERVLPGEAYDLGVRLVIPRGTRSIVLLPHDGPFFARRVDADITPLNRPRRAGARQIFRAAPGVDASAGRFALADAEAAITHVSGMTLDPDGRFDTSTHDPLVGLRLRAPVGPGWVRVTADLLADRDLAPRLYASRDGGFHENDATDLMKAGAGRYVGYIRLASAVQDLRFDPCDVAGVTGKLLGVQVEAVATPGLAVLKPAVLWAIRRNRLARRTARALLGLPTGEEHVGLPARVIETGPTHTVDERADYDRWIARHDFELRRDGPRYEQQVAAMETRPLVSILMPVYKTPLALLDEAIQSVVDQIYPNWELCIADDCSGDPRLKARLEHWAQRDSRIKLVFCERNGGISAATNAAFAEASGDWIALLDHDDMLRPHALAEVMLSIQPDTELVYSDEDKIDERGVRYDPFFKPDFSLHLFRGQNYFNHLTVHRAENIRAVGGWRSEFDGSQDYDINLRIIEHIGGEGVLHLPAILYHWRSVAGSAAAAVDGKSYTFDAGLNALLEHLGRTEDGASVKRAGQSPFYRVGYPLPDPAPKVSLIIPTRDRVDLLRLSVGSILEKTAYAPYEILIVDNQSTDPDTLAYFAELESRENVRILSYDKPFNFSAINNFAVQHARGEIIGLINNDVEVINSDWLWEMVSLAVREEVGCVGAKLFYPDGRIQHGGVVIGIGSVAGHSHKYLPGDTFGYFGRMSLVHEVSAVTAACLLVRREIYELVGGLNETDLTVAFNDVDFCLKVREQGYLNLMTPFAELYHHESVSRGGEDSPEKIARFQKEIAYMHRRWRTNTEPDPYYSVHLSHTHEDYRLNA